ncbi:hypothetical protein ACFU77_05270, partial [Streptomyces fimicarius]
PLTTLLVTTSGILLSACDRVVDLSADAEADTNADADADDDPGAGSVPDAASAADRHEPNGTPR